MDNFDYIVFMFGTMSTRSEADVVWRWRHYWKRTWVNRTSPLICKVSILFNGWTRCLNSSKCWLLTAIYFIKKKINPFFLNLITDMLKHKTNHRLYIIGTLNWCCSAIMIMSKLALGMKGKYGLCLSSAPQPPPWQEFLRTTLKSPPTRRRTSQCKAMSLPS